jgi:hypothetical protein
MQEGFVSAMLVAGPLLEDVHPAVQASVPNNASSPETTASVRATESSSVGQSSVAMRTDLLQQVWCTLLLRGERAILAVKARGWSSSAVAFGDNRRRSARPCARAAWTQDVGL